MFVPPAGPGVPAANASEAWAAATADCRQSQNYKALLHVSGRAGGDRLWPFALETALTSDGAIYMSATTSGQSIFVLAGTAREATLWLRRETARSWPRPAPSSKRSSVCRFPPIGCCRC
jgi:hypothetical protein